MICENCDKLGSCSGLPDDCDLLYTVIARTTLAMMLDDVVSIKNTLIGTLEYLQRNGCKTYADIEFLDKLMSSSYIFKRWLRVKDAAHPKDFNPPEGILW